MKITGTIEVTCPLCGVTSEHQLVQSIHVGEAPEAKARLLAGELNVAQCACGKRTQLESSLVFHDPAAGLICHVCPDGEVAMQRAEAAFAASFAGAASPVVQRIVPSLNALLEKIKIADAGLLDWAVEMTKVLLLASISIEDDDRVMLFTGVELGAGPGAGPGVDPGVDPGVGPGRGGEDGELQWLLFDRYGERPEIMASPMAGYRRLINSTGEPPTPEERRIDRAWAIEAVRQLINRGN